MRPSSARRCSCAADCGAARNWARRWTTSDPLGDVGRRQRPVDRRVAAAGDDDAAAAEILAAAHQVEDAALLEFFYPGERRPVRSERAGAGGDHHGAGDDAPARHVLDDEALRRGAQPEDGMAEVKCRRERGGLLEQPVDQFGRIDLR